MLPPKAIAFTTLAQLCAFFHCSPNDLLIVDWEGEEIEQSPQIMKQKFTRPEAMQLGFADEIWDTF
ncbi:MAG: helix-turn-helix domain-containing protein [Moorea sp. SIO4A3]|nr:helix-turn-helix domain-containing protein [Moorena sp. SIO4A3]NEQ82446.1 helix-turn-helix domain-containing protein [Moorena sp. SIO2I5]